MSPLYSLELSVARLDIVLCLIVCETLAAWVVRVSYCRYLLQHDGLFIGSSSAMHVVGAARAAFALGPGHTIVTVLCDSGSRHMTRFWNDDFLRGRGIEPPPPSFSPSPADLSFLGLGAPCSGSG